jgi:glycerophosphoryl diester phosphodiesterase
MVTPLPSLRVPPIAFAHRGAKAHAPENTIESFALARRLGATGLESDVWCTADGVAVLDHDGFVGNRLRRRTIADVARADLPPHIPALADLYDECGTDFELSLDVKDPAALAATIDVARAADRDAPRRLWLCFHDWRVLAEWRQDHRDVRLVDSTRLRHMRHGPERRAAQLSDAGVDAVNLHESDWTGGLTTLFHRFGLCTFGWDAQFERVLDNLLAMGIDGVYSDHVDRMMEAVARLRS